MWLTRNFIQFFCQNIMIISMHIIIGANIALVPYSIIEVRNTRIQPTENVTKTIVVRIISGGVIKSS